LYYTRISWLLFMTRITACQQLLHYLYMGLADNEN